MNNMTVVYADAEEKYVKNVILYGKTADNYLYTDSKCCLLYTSDAADEL